MQEYTARLKALEGLNLGIDITGCAQTIEAFLVIERLASVKGYN